MPPYLLLRDDRCLQWSKFSSWLNWCAIRCRRWRTGGIAAASSASRAGAGVAGNAPVHDPETRASAADPAFLSIFLVKQALNARVMLKQWAGLRDVRRARFREIVALIRDIRQHEYNNEWGTPM